MQLLACDFANRGGERDLLAVGGELGDFAGRARVQGGRRHGAARQRALLRLPRRAVRRQGGARIGMVNYAVPAEKLERRPSSFAQKLMKKSPAGCVQPSRRIKHVRTMDVAQAYDYLAEKGKAIKVADSQIPTTRACGNSSTRNPTSRHSSRSGSTRAANDRKRRRRNSECSFVFEARSRRVLVRPLPPSQVGLARLAQDLDANPGKPGARGEGAGRVRCSAHSSRHDSQGRTEA